ncbi:MAG: hypothetical protein ACI3XM_02350 [Eubacteriales bacterium]
MKIQFETTLERDIDLLIMEEFVSDPLFAKLFLDAVDINDSYRIEEVIHSKTNVVLGESDIVIILNINNKRHAIHIEDKIDALAMPRQHDRYDLRAQKDIATGEYDSYSVLIVAPAKYLEANKEAKKYAHQVQYEQLRDFYATKSDPRSEYKLALIDRAILEQKNGYQWEANPDVVAFCTAMNTYKKTKYPGLPDGSIAWWSNYPTLISGATIVFKANKGFCDLQFAHTTARDLFARVKDYLSDRMNVVQAGKSASIRITVTPIRLENRFEDKIKEVDEALEALWELYALSKRLAVENSN